MSKLNPPPVHTVICEVGDDCMYPHAPDVVHEIDLNSPYDFKYIC